MGGVCGHFGPEQDEIRVAIRARTVFRLRKDVLVAVGFLEECGLFKEHRREYATIGDAYGGSA